MKNTATVINFPVQQAPKQRLTKRGRMVVAIGKGIATVLAIVVGGLIVGHALVEGYAADAKVRDAQNAPYIQAAQEKAARNAR